MSRFHLRKDAALSLAAMLLALGAITLLTTVTHAQQGTAITPSFGDDKLKVLGTGFKPNEKVTITVKINSITSTIQAAANAQGSFELDTGLDLAPSSSVELDARGDQGSGGTSITSVPILPLPQTGAVSSSIEVPLIVGLLLIVVGGFLASRRIAI